MKDIFIEKFWTKLMVASKSVNKIPTEYMKYSQNARIFDWWIWPRKWKRLIINSTLWTKNQGAFELNSKLYQVTNSKIYEIDTVNETQTEIDDLWYDERVDVLVYNSQYAIIASEWEILQVFDWTTITTPATVPAWDTGGILEYTRWYSFYWIWNILYISRPITAANPEYGYDFTGAWSQNISFDSKITGLKGTMNWLYIFTEDKVEFIWANSLQNVAWAAAFISTPLWFGWEPVNNLCIAASWEKIFYITKNLQVNTINYIQWTDSPTIWQISNRPVISIKEFLNTISPEQPSAFAFYNKNDEIIEFHVRENNSLFDNKVLVYDIPNDTWNIDIWKNYNYVVKFWYENYWFSDINSNIYKDNEWYNDAWTSIKFLLRTQNMNQWAIRQKLYWWLLTAWWVWTQTELKYKVLVDNQSVFTDSITWNINNIDSLWEIGGETIWWEPIWWELNYISEITPFDRIADEWRIWNSGKRIQIEISSNSQIQDFIIDVLWIRAKQTSHTDISSKW